jgi:hypothetical protein
MKRNLLPILFLILFGTMLCAGSWVQPTENKQAISKEWRLPTEDELIKNWKWTKKEIEENLKIIGDFDEDRVNDEAQLMVKKDHSAMGFLVVFSPIFTIVFYSFVSFPIFNKLFCALLRKYTLVISC